MKSQNNISILPATILAASLAFGVGTNVHATDYTWGGGTHGWSDTSPSGWNGGPPAAWVGDTATINSGTVTTTAESNENGIAITLGGTGILNTTGGYFAEFTSLSFVNGGTLTAVGGDAVWGAGALGSFSVSGSSSSGALINGSYFNVRNGSTFDVADITGNTDADLTISALLNRLDFELSAAITKTGAGTLSLAVNNVLNNIASVTIAGGTISQTTGNGWNQLNSLALLGATLESVSTSLSTFGCYWLPGTVTVSGASASAFTTVGSGEQFLNLGDLGSSTGSTTFNVDDVTSSPAADVVVSTKLGNQPLGGASGLIKNGSGTMALNAANTYTGGTAINAGTLEFASGSLSSTVYVGLVGGTLRWAPGNTETIDKIFIFNDTTGTLDTNDNNVTLGAIQDNAYNHAGSLVKTGAGELTFTGANNYTGNTTVADGALVVASSGSLHFRPTANNTSNSVSGSATASLAFLGTVDLDLSGADATNGNSWNLFNLASFSGAAPVLTPAAVSSSLGSFTEVSPGRWELPVTGATWVFTEGDGNLAYTTATTDYGTWKIDNGVTGGPGDDDDSDGLMNFEEYAFGLIPSSATSITPIAAPLDKSSGTFSYTRRQQSLTGLTYTVWYSTNLGNWTQDTGATEGTPDLVGDVETVPVTLTTSLLENPSLFIRLRAESQK